MLTKKKMDIKPFNIGPRRLLVALGKQSLSKCVDRGQKAGKWTGPERGGRDPIWALSDQQDSLSRWMVGTELVSETWPQRQSTSTYGLGVELLPKAGEGLLYAGGLVFTAFQVGGPRPDTEGWAAWWPVQNHCLGWTVAFAVLLRSQMRCFSGTILLHLHHWNRLWNTVPQRLAVGILWFRFSTTNLIPYPVGWKCRPWLAQAYPRIQSGVS